MNSRYLHDLLPISPAFDRPIRHLSLDSRQIGQGDVFFACQGQQQHGKQFIAPAIKAGAAVILLEQTGEIFEQDGVLHIPYPKLGLKASRLAAHFYQRASENMRVIAVTGTNGKTSISHYIAQSLPAPCGLLGTLGYGVYGQLNAGLHTTPDAVYVQRLFAELAQQGVQNVVMEVSSHALAQQRTADVAFDMGVFSNLSRDHLDYHPSMAAYADSKRRLFFDYPLTGAIINQDDDFGQELLHQLPCNMHALGYSLQNPKAALYAQYQMVATGYELDIQTPWGASQIHSPLPALFNVSNLLAALGALLLAGVDLSTASHRLAQLKPAAGRMEQITTANGVTVIIDYAHTPDALAKALASCRAQCEKQLWCVFGCGGNRDPGKRPLMGEMAQNYADHIILTNDNPRNEDPAQIIADIQRGMHPPTLCLFDRQTAIEHALSHAQAGDWLLIAGKGHESYQEIKGQRFDFNDKAVVAQFLANP